MVSIDPLPGWKLGISRVWLGHPFHGNCQFLGTAFPVQGTLFLTAAHVATFLANQETGNSNPGYVSSQLFSAPQRIVQVRLPEHWSEATPECDAALLDIGNAGPAPPASVVPLVASREGWTSDEMPTWLMGFGRDPAMSLSTIPTSFRSTYPPNRTIIFDGHVDVGSSGGPVMTPRGACGVIRGRVPDTGEIEVVPVTNIAQFLSANAINLAKASVPPYPDPRWSRDERVAWVKSFPPGPPLSASVVETSLIRLFASGYKDDRAELFRTEVNALRKRADPQLNMDTVGIWSLGSPGKMGEDEFFMKLLHAAAQQGPRTMASVLVSAGPAILDGGKSDITELIETLYATWNKYRCV